nr:MAG TPA: hypothetical protein [Caudoviricetes sp.]
MRVKQLLIETVVMPESQHRPPQFQIQSPELIARGFLHLASSKTNQPHSHIPCLAWVRVTLFPN